MNKEKIIFSLWQEARRREKIRKYSSQLTLAIILLVISYAVLVLISWPKNHSLLIDYWPLYIGYAIIFLILVIILPFGKIQKKKVDKVFYEVIEQAANDCSEQIGRLTEHIVEKNSQLNLLKSNNEFFIALIKKNIAKKELACE